jgi:hypothetical protein
MFWKCSGKILCSEEHWYTAEGIVNLARPPTPPGNSWDTPRCKLKSPKSGRSRWGNELPDLVLEDLSTFKAVCVGMLTGVNGCLRTKLGSPLVDSVHVEVSA